MTRSVQVAGIVVIALVSIACGARDGDADASPPDAPSSADAAERAACENIAGSEGPCAPGGDVTACVEGLIDVRTEHAEGCEPEYEAWLACLTALSVCDSSSGVLCPTEYSALGMCSL